MNANPQSLIAQSLTLALCPWSRTAHDPHDLDAVKRSRLYKVFYPLMAPLLHFRARGLGLFA